MSIDQKIQQIHSSLKLDHGSFYEEFPEQRLSVKYLTGKEKVLEIGGNIGRNSLVIAHILSQQGNNNFVSLESNEEISEQLRHNRDMNNFKFL